MKEIVRINLDNEMDLILSHRRTMKLAELCGLSMPAQTTFATAVSEIARVAIGQGKNSYMTLNIDAASTGKKEIAAILYDKVDLRKINPEAFSYAMRLISSIDTCEEKGWFQIQLNFRINFAGLISPAKIETFTEYFENEPPLSAYDEIRKKNVQLIQMNDKLTESENRYRTLSQSLELLVKERTGELMNLNEDLEKKNKELESFAYISSHDLQEPLRKIQTFATRIVEKEYSNLSESGKDFFERMRHSANRMQKLIDDLLAYSRTNTYESQFEKMDLNVIFKKIKEDLKDELTEKNAILEAAELHMIEGIPFQMYQLLMNLISNSLKFSAAGIPPKILVESKIAKGVTLLQKKLKAEKMYCHISVKDNGIGFDQVYSERIFELFQRLHGRMEYKGTGVGLAIVKKIVQNHHGFIFAEGEQGKGATFNIYLPVE